MAKNFEDLECWKLAVGMDKSIFTLTNESALSSDYSLKNQMLRSVGSIADNIAEGFERGGNKELIQFLYIAKGYCGELSSQLHRAKNRVLISDEDYLKFISQCRLVSGKLMNLIIANKNSDLKGSKYHNSSDFS